MRTGRPERVVKKQEQEDSRRGNTTKRRETAEVSTMRKSAEGPTADEVQLKPGKR